MAREQIVLSKEEVSGISKTRHAVLGAVADFVGFRTKLAKFGGEVNGLFTRMVAARASMTPPQAFGLADFARLYDPTVPSHARATPKNDSPGYTAHKTYMTLDYMRRMIQRPRGGNQGEHNVSTDKVARTIKTILTLVDPADHAEIWDAVSKVFGMTPIALTRLKGWVRDAEPVLDLSAVVKRPIHIKGAPLGPMAIASKKAPTTDDLLQQAEAMQGGRKGVRVRKSA